MCWESSLASQYTYLVSFISTNYKRNRTREMCSDGTLNNELELIHNILVKISCPQGFQKNHFDILASKKPSFPKPQFNRDIAGDLLRDILTGAIRSKSNAAILLSVLQLTSGDPQLKDKLPCSAKLYRKNYFLYIGGQKKQVVTIFLLMYANIESRKPVNVCAK